MLQAKTAQENLIPALPLFLDTIRGQRSLITQLELPQLRQKVIIPYFYKMSNLFVKTDSFALVVAPSPRGEGDGA
jgi:hypothetical protein